MLVLFICLLLLSSCGGRTFETGAPDPWVIAAIEYSFPDRLHREDAPPHVSYTPGNGYRFLAVYIKATNIGPFQASLTNRLSSWLVSDGQYKIRNIVRSDGGATPPTLYIGELPYFFAKGETRSGNVYFRIPDDFDVTNATLEFRYWGGGASQFVVFDLSLLPSVEDDIQNAHS